MVQFLLEVIIRSNCLIVTEIQLNYQQKYVNPYRQSHRIAEIYSIFRWLNIYREKLTPKK